MNLELRPYQEDAYNFLMGSKDNTCVQMPTGSGKSIVMSKYIQDCEAKTLVVVPSRELVKNISGYLPEVSTQAMSGIQPDLSKQVLVSTYKSASKYLSKFKPEMVLSDECHLSVAKTWKGVLDSSNCVSHGFTATPNRLDGQGLITNFRKLYTSPSIRWFISNKYLADYQLITVPAPEFSSKNFGDSLHEQEQIFGSNPEIKKTVEIFLQYCVGEKSLFFVSSRLHGLFLEENLKHLGISASFVDHKTPDRIRNRALNDFEHGNLNVLINVELFTTGVNLLKVQNVFLCRFTYSTSLYLQMVGRLVRPANVVKKLFDLAGNTWVHGSLYTPFEWDLRGQPFRPSSNKDSVFVRCKNCGEVLTHKKNILQYTLLCCTNCQHENPVEPTYAENKKNKKYYVGNQFSLELSSEIDPKIMSILTSVMLNTRLKNESKISKILDIKVPDKAKEIALKYIGIHPKTIDFYLRE